VSHDASRSTGRNERHLCLAAIGMMLMLVGCDRSMTRDVRDGAKLTARVQEVIRPGSDSAAARRILEVQGFQCQMKLGSEVDTLEKGLEPPPARLTCQKSVSVKKKSARETQRFLVDVLLDSATVRGIESRVWLERTL
jgi:hypothetical protein